MVIHDQDTCTVCPAFGQFRDPALCIRHIHGVGFQEVISRECVGKKLVYAWRDVIDDDLSDAPVSQVSG